MWPFSKPKKFYVGYADNWKCFTEYRVTGAKSNITPVRTYYYIDSKGVRSVEYSPDKFNGKPVQSLSGWSEHPSNHWIREKSGKVNSIFYAPLTVPSGEAAELMKDEGYSWFNGKWIKTIELADAKLKFAEAQTAKKANKVKESNPVTATKTTKAKKTGYAHRRNNFVETIEI